MTQQTLTRLRHLKLTGMADAVQQQLEQASTYVSIHRNSIDTGKMRRSSLDPTFLLA
ncbi:hypothetical protein KAM469_43860 [Aeromonas caviae]|nr:hypothetical protein KAM466_42740 [Aeromonas caviae]GKR21260.1 hypothetical protein KAM467_43040 [Aeromonas caviae]GKR25541.1 hypothetical protein KAM468_42810 [Aeromonas caviae]GKR29927.1 hypothetical protein KAM469_43860 [Aeromonas caviae]GKR68079.1 hypothetical protein KAM478_43360 [Aeromonas caviae]